MPDFSRIRTVAATAAIATTLTLGVTGVADAAEPKTCSSFASLLDAQSAFDLDEIGLAGLDIELGGVRNEIVCDKPVEDADRSDTGGSDKKDSDKKDSDKKSDADARKSGDKDCADFGSQAKAQAVLDEDSDDPNNLDADRDGVACEDRFESDDQQVKVHPDGSVNTGGMPVR